MTEQPFWLAAATYSQVARGHLGVPCFLWSLGLRGHLECPKRQENGAKVRTHTFSQRTSSSQGAANTHSWPLHPPAPRLQDPLLIPVSNYQKSKEGILGKVFTQLIKWSSLKVKPNLCLIKTKSVQVILWLRDRTIKPHGCIILKGCFRNSSVPKDEFLHNSWDGCQGERSGRRKISQRRWIALQQRVPQ